MKCQRFNHKVASAAAGILVQRRYLERPGGAQLLGSRAPWWTRTGALDKMFNVSSSNTTQLNTDALFECGNATLNTVDNSTLGDVEAELHSYRSAYQHYQAETNSYVIHRVNADDAQLAREVFGKMMSRNAFNEWWDRVLRDYPTFKQTLTPAVQKEWEEYALHGLTLVDNADELKPLALKFVTRMTTERLLPYWSYWPIFDRLMDALDNQPGMMAFDRKIQRVCFEIVGKVTMNAFNELPWGTEDLNNPLFADVQPTRIYHEPGLREAVFRPVVEADGTSKITGEQVPPA